MRMRKIVPHETEMTLKTAMDEFIRVCLAQKLSQVTMRDYRQQLGRFLCASQNSLAYQQLEEDTLDYFSAIPDTSPARYNKPYQNLMAFFRWMVKKNYIPKNPIKENGLKKRRDDGNIKPIGVEELRCFMDCLDKRCYTDLRVYTIILIMMDCGIRTQEILGLREGDFCAMTATLKVSKIVAKTRCERQLYLSEKTVRAIVAFLRVKPKEWNDWLFPNYEGNQLTTTYLDRDFAKISARCGVKITPYQLRHSFATLYLKNGGDLFTLQKQMGHSDLRMTKRYTEIDDEFTKTQHESFSPVNLLEEKHKVIKIG